VVVRPVSSPALDVEEDEPAEDDDSQAESDDDHAVGSGSGSKQRRRHVSKKYQCRYCPKRFHQNSNLVTHERYG